MAKIIAIMNEKGGVGKTATATTLAYLLAKQGKKTAVLDFDGQGHSSIICGIKNPNKVEVTISTLLNKIIMDEPLPQADQYIFHIASNINSARAVLCFYLLRKTNLILYTAYL